jgi:hypothetical protein
VLEGEPEPAAEPEGDAEPASEPEDEPEDTSRSASQASSAPPSEGEPDREEEPTETIPEAPSSASSVNSSLKGSMDSASSNPDGPISDVEEDNLDPEFKRKFSAARSEFIQLKNSSILIQRKLLEVFPALGFDDSSSSVGLSDFPHRYQDALDRLEMRRSELDHMKAHNDETLRALQEQCSEADHRRLEREEKFGRLREESGRTSIMSRTNKPIRPTDLNSKESMLSAKNFELEVTRIDFIRTRNRHKQAEDELSKQDQLSEGLHLIDFEQLKIENQALNEKKAGKNQDLVKIEDKIKVNAHMLTHVKEKLAHIRKQKQILHVGRQQTEDSYAQARAKLAHAKIKRDSVRDENSSLKKSSGLIGMTDLLYDFENRTNELETMQERITDLKTRFNDLGSMQREYEAKISQRQPIDSALFKLNR